MHKYPEAAEEKLVGPWKSVCLVFMWYVKNLHEEARTEISKNQRELIQHLEFNIKTFNLKKKNVMS